MGVFSGPDVSESGLVLAVDGANYKSFKGEVTTNILTNGNFSSGLTGWSSYNGATQTVQSVTDIPIYQNTLKTVSNFVSSSTISVGNYGGTFQGVSMTAGVTYTISYYARSLSGNMTLKFSFQSGAGDENNMSHSNVITSQWTRYTYTATLNTAKNTMFVWNSSTASAVFQITDVQIEAKSYATTFTTGTRGSTVATGGGWADLTGNGNNGELVNGVRENSDNLGSLVFDGVDDYINCGTFFNYTNFTISLWVYPGSTQTTYADIFDNNHAGTQNFVCQQNATNTNQYAFACLNATNVSSTSNFTLTANTWHYLTFTWNNSVASAYINGVFNSSGAAANPINYVSPILSIGRWSATGRHWNGRISNFVAHNRVLTATEIQQNFNATRGRYGI